MAIHEGLTQDVEPAAAWLEEDSVALIALGMDDLRAIAEQCVPPQGHNTPGPFTSVVGSAVSAYQEGF